jgi:hypothetical protein
MIFEEVELLARLDAIGGDAKAELAAHTDNRSDDRRVGFVGCDDRDRLAAVAPLGGPEDRSTR